MMPVLQIAQNANMTACNHRLWNYNTL